MLLDFPFQLYGLILSVALMVGWSLSVYKAKQHQVSVPELESAATYAVIFGILGARLWHVFTDWQLYQAELLGILKIWEGGLSIIGAVAGGVIGLGMWRMITRQHRLPVMAILDLSVFGLPFAQAIGRWGNYVNQELYGWPTSLPWGLYIEPQFRLSGLESFSRFHPLFLYESIAMAIFGVSIWLLDHRSRSQVWTIGSGFYFWLYLTYYAVLRFGLDFMRPDKAYSLGLDLGTNQLVLIVVMVIGMLNLVRLWRARHAS